MLQQHRMLPRIMRAWTGCAVSYRIGDAGQACPTGYSSIVDVAACKVAAYIVGLTSVDVRPEPNDRPHGCYQFNPGAAGAQIAIFNTNTGGHVNDKVQLICTSDSTTAEPTTAAPTTAAPTTAAPTTAAPTAAAMAGI